MELISAGDPPQRHPPPDTAAILQQLRQRRLHFFGRDGVAEQLHQPRQRHRIIRYEQHPLPRALDEIEVFVYDSISVSVVNPSLKRNSRSSRTSTMSPPVAGCRATNSFKRIIS